MYRLPVSSASHPFFTGSKQFIDSEGRVDKVVKRYAKKPEKKVEVAPPAEDAAKKKSKPKKKSTP